MRTTNLAGRTYALIVLTPIRPGLQDELRAYLGTLPGEDSPLARVERTHMARLLIVDDMPTPPGTDLADPLGNAYLLFTSTFDGELDGYLDELCERLAPEAAQIWGRCIGCPDPPAGAALKTCLAHNQIESGLAFAAYGDASVAQVRSALDKRERLTRFVIRAQNLDPAARRSAFLEEFGAR